MSSWLQTITAKFKKPVGDLADDEWDTIPAGEIAIDFQSFYELDEQLSTGPQELTALARDTIVSTPPAITRTVEIVTPAKPVELPKAVVQEIKVPLVKLQEVKPQEIKLANTPIEKVEKPERAEKRDPRKEVLRLYGDKFTEEEILLLLNAT